MTMANQQLAPFGGEPSNDVFRIPTDGELGRRTDHMARLKKWAELYVDIGTAAKYLAATEFVPDGFRNKPEAVAAAMMKATELGMDPLDGLQNMHVVKGKVGFSAELMRRRIIEAGHEIRFKETTDTRCVIEGRRKGQDEWQRVTFTAENAKTAGIDIKSYPADKLVARASSRLCRRVFPDVLGGSLIIEDVIDGEIVDIALDATPATQAKAVESAPITRKTSTRKAPAKKSAPKVDRVNDPSEQPPLPGDDDAGSAPTEEKVTEVGQNSKGEERITPAQNKMLHTLMTKEGLTDRAQAMAWLSENLKRDISTSNDLSKTEASSLIDQLQQWQQADAEKGN